MAPLRRTASIDSFDMTCQDTVKQVSALRKDGLVGTLDSDPLLAFQLPRVEIGIRAISIAGVSRMQEDDRTYPSFFGLLAGFFSPRPKGSVNSENLRLRGMRHVKDARKTITQTAKERESILAVCEYAFDEVYVRDFDDDGPRFNVKLFPQQFSESDKECLYERSRLLRYLSLRLMSTSGLFSVYYRQGKSEEVMRALSRDDRDTLMQLKSRLGTSPEYRGITSRLTELLNETITANRKAQYSRNVNQIIRTAEKTIGLYENFMHLEKSLTAAVETERRSLEELMSSWLKLLRDFDLSSGVHDLNGPDKEPSGLTRLLVQQMDNQQASQRESGFAELKTIIQPVVTASDISSTSVLLRELGLNVLLKGSADSLGIRRIGEARGSFGDIGKYLLQKPTRFPGVPWAVSELAVKTVRLTAGPLRYEEATRRQCRRIVRESRVWSKMQHERIVPILGVWDTQEQDTIFCMISPWISDCQLDHYVASAGCQKLEALVLLHDIASGLDYMHNFGSGVVHGDLKPDNILVKDGRAFITDFGLSHSMDGPGGLTSEVHGNPAWLAPEAIAATCEKRFNRQTFKPTFAQDIYSFGCLFLFVAYKELPFERLGDNPGGILSERQKYPYENPIGMNDAARLDVDYCYLMLECWRIDPTLRISARLALACVEKFMGAEKRKTSLRVSSDVSPEREKTGRSSNASLRCPSQDLLSKSRPSVSQNTELVFALLSWQMKENRFA